MRVEKVEELVERVREHYVDQFRRFSEKQRGLCKIGAPEVKFELTGDTNAFHRIAVVDFVRNDHGVEGVLFEPENILSFERIDGQIGDADLIISGLRWDSVTILHDVKDASIALEDWFVSWFDPDESERFDLLGDISRCIHAVYIEEFELQIDLGTASSRSFWDLLDCLARAGATKLHISA